MTTGEASMDAQALRHLQRLVGVWGVMADLSFSDLILLAPSPLGGSQDLAVPGGGGVLQLRERDVDLVVLGQVRPTTTATLLSADLVGQVGNQCDWPLAAEALQSGAVATGVASVPAPVSPSRERSERGPTPVAEVHAVCDLGSNDTGEVPAVPERAQLECVPVGYMGETVGVMVRVSALGETRRSGRLERMYRELYQRLATMVRAGAYPFPGEDVATGDAPRVGDGLVVVDGAGRIRYASPNAVTALHRMGVDAAAEGRRFAEIGVEESAIDHSLATGRPVIEEMERRPDVIVLVHCTPLIESGTVTGAMVLVRDVTDLRRLGRLLLSKEAAIREVHHRVKNNLQTISSLLRLQARRLDPGHGREALREAERRVRSIAVVHEVLSREPGDEVPFYEIVESLVRMVEDSVVSGQRVELRVTGDPGGVPADVATPLAVVLAELLQNAVEHAFGSAGAEGGSEILSTRPEPPEGVARHVDLVLANDGSSLSVQVSDNGRGLPEGFDIDQTTSLGLSIVRDLVRSQLNGSIVMDRVDGTLVSIRIPLADPVVAMPAEL